MKKLWNPGVHERPFPQKTFSPEEILAMPNVKALVEFANYDGPLRGLLERIIQATEGYLPDAVPKGLVIAWGLEAKRLMNVVYKLNGLEDRWEVLRTESSKEEKHG